MLLLAFSIAIATSTCAPSNDLDDAKASACHLTGGRPNVQAFAYCTTKPGSCRWSRTYKGCAR